MTPQKKKKKKKNTLKQTKVISNPGPLDFKSKAFPLGHAHLDCIMVTNQRNIRATEKNWNLVGKIIRIWPEHKPTPTHTHTHTHTHPYTHTPTHPPTHPPHTQYRTNYCTNQGRWNTRLLVHDNTCASILNVGSAQ